MSIQDLCIVGEDKLKRSFILPKKILWKTDGVDGEALLVESKLEQIYVGMPSPTKLSTESGKKAAILLDFGSELVGSLELLVSKASNSDGVHMHIRFGESASEAMTAIAEKNATNDHATRDTSVLLTRWSQQTVGYTGYRFVYIELEDKDAWVDLAAVRGIFTYRDIPYLGSFGCENKRLEQIYNVSAYTVHLCMQNMLWDGIKRDRLVWIGDLHPEVMTVSTVFGYNEVIPKSLDLIRDMTPVPEWMNGISSYSIWWLLIHRDWYYYQGDLNYLREQKTYLTTLLNHLMTKIDEKGKETLDGNRFLDWPSSTNPKGVDAGLQALMLMAMNAGAEMALALDDASLATRCQEAAKKLSRYVPHHNQSKQGAALMAIAGLMDAKKADKEVLSVGGSKNYSTFYGYYMLEALAKAGNYQEALDRISEYWGAMLDLGATTFWEDFNIEWTKNAARIDELVPEGKVDVHQSYGDYCYKGFRHSLCHGWASGPTAWLSRYVLGVQVLEPGCKKVRIEPHLGNLKWVEGTFPTPHGDIRIRHEKGADGQVKSDIQAPEGVEVIR